jgi:DNA primase catalytic core
MMGLHKLTAGDGYTYLTRQVAAMDSTEKGHASLADYYAQKGESPGRWLGSGLGALGIEPGEQVTAAQMKALFGEGRHPNADAIEAKVIEAGGTKAAALKAGALGRAFPVYDEPNTWRLQLAARYEAHNSRDGLPRDWPLPAPVKARIRTQLATEMFTEAFGRAPADARELSGYIARVSRQATTAVAGYDLTFSPVKSVSALWAIAPPQIAEQIEAAHHDAVGDTLRFLEAQVAFTRTGRAGVRQVETNGIVAAAFTHRDSRTGDPDLHTHVTVSNKTQTRDGRWLALDGRVLYKAKVSLSERYNTRLEAHLFRRVGAVFAERPGRDKTKRPIREIVGVDAELNAFWSSRRAAIDARRAELAAAFQGEHMRPPTEIEAIALAQHATLETRPGKHEPRSLAEQRAAWRQQALRVLGGSAALQRMIAAAAGGHRETPPPQPREITARFVTGIAARTIGVVQSGRATWQTWHVRAEAERQTRAAGIALEHLDELVDRVVDHVLGTLSIGLGHADLPEPEPLRRSDGASVYQVAGSRLYTSTAILQAEKSLLTAAQRRDGRTITGTAVGVALAESAANRLELNPAQAQMVRELATSGARVQVAIAPAGSGKTTAMRVLARAWIDSGGDVVGLAPSARAAAELRQATQTRSDTLAKLTHSLSTGRLPDWVRGIGPHTLVIIDEAGMAGTADLAQAVNYILARGGSVRLVGDDQQLASIAAGGVLRDIADQVGVVTLSELQRFTDRAEGAATLALRQGDTAGLGFYLDHGRVHVGDETTVTDQVYRAWAGDHDRGLNSVMLAPTRELVSILNARARADRLAAQPEPAGRDVLLADGNHASSGDVILTRQNDRHLPISATDWVKNGDRWTVRTVHRSGAIVAVHTETGRTVTLPGDYVAENAELGYAATVHGAQGITADTCHTLASGQESRQLFYVAMTRGRAANHVYLVTASDGDPHNVVKPEALFPPTATDILTAILDRDQAQQSAASATRELADPATLLHEAAARYHDALGLAAEQVIGTDTLTALDKAADQMRPGLTQAPAYPTLRSHLALLAVDGTSPIELLRAVAGPAARELDTARDPAAVCDWRLDPHRSHTPAGPLPWLPAVPEALAAHPDWGRYLTGRADRVVTLADQLREHATRWMPTTAPTWATRLLDPTHEVLRADLAVWRAAIGITETDRRPTGGPQLAAAAARYQGDLDRRAKAVLGDPQQTAGAWAPVLTRIDPRITADEFWPDLADRLAAIDRAGIDVRGMVAAVADQHRLPDEHPAAALWWRLARHLTPAATAATAGSGAATLRPAWTPILVELLGAARAHRVTADPAWPALVAAVDTAPRDQWTPDRLVRIAAELALAGGSEVADADLAPALVWRIAMLTDPAPLDYETTPPDPAQAELAPPDDLHLLDQPHALENAASLPPTELAALETPTMAALVNDEVPPYRLDYDTTPTHAADPGAFTHAQPRTGPVQIDLDTPNDEALFALQLRGSTSARRERLLELNQRALEFFRAHYRDKWASDYVTERLGINLADDDRFQPGYAPAGWTALTEHLHALGATNSEIVDAGLGSYARTGRVIDRFRDRLVAPIYHHGELRGFVGRRNPAHTDDDPHAGPKYLNTAETDLYSKGERLYGYDQNRAALAAGAQPVLVEGLLDAWAVTLAGEHTDPPAVGLATLGTAFTDRHADQLRPHLRPGRPAPVVGFDPDPAGRRAAEHTYWKLTERGAAPDQLALPDDLDPAQLYQDHGAAALSAALRDNLTPLARTLINARMTFFLARIREFQDRGFHDVNDRIFAVRRAAEVIAALPEHQWYESATYVAEQTGVPFTDIPAEIINAHTALRPATGRHHDTRQPSPPVPPAPPTQRWADTAGRISPALLAAPDWPSLAHAIDRAHAAGYHVAEHLPRLAAQPPLSPTHPARDLHYRLLAAAPAAAANPSDATRRADRAAIDQDARRRLADHHHSESTAQPRTDQDTNPEQERPEDRWRNLIGSIDARILTDDGWTALAATLDLAAATGLNVADELPRLAIADGPLPSRRAAAELRYRVLASVDLDPAAPRQATPDPSHSRANKPAELPSRSQPDRPTPQP